MLAIGKLARRIHHLSLDAKTIRLSHAKSLTMVLNKSLHLCYGKARIILTYNLKLLWTIYYKKILFKYLYSIMHSMWKITLLKQFKKRTSICEVTWVCRQWIHTINIWKSIYSMTCVDLFYGQGFPEMYI